MPCPLGGLTLKISTTRTGDGPEEHHFISVKLYIPRAFFAPIGHPHNMQC